MLTFVAGTWVAGAVLGVWLVSTDSELLAIVALGLVAGSASGVLV
jgi:hypothetical protein